MKVLFLYPLWTGETKGISRYFARTSGGTYIPYNLALLAAITEKVGHESKIIDGELEKISLNEIKNIIPPATVLQTNAASIPQIPLYDEVLKTVSKIPPPLNFVDDYKFEL